MRFDEFKKIPMLERQVENDLCAKWRNNHCVTSRNTVLTHNLRHVAHIAMCFSRTYHFPFDDLMQEGLIGATRAMDKYEPERNLRFCTYLVYWVRVAIKNYILKNWRVAAKGDRRLRNCAMASVWAVLPDMELFCEMFPDDSPLQDELLSRKEDESEAKETMNEGFDKLLPREKTILVMRFGSDEKHSLAEIGRSMQISRERTRQLQERALKKLRRQVGHV